jgi:hypothetical protein
MQGITDILICSSVSSKKISVKWEQFFIYLLIFSSAFFFLFLFLHSCQTVDDILYIFYMRERESMYVMSCMFCDGKQDSLEQLQWHR